ncbi:MAG: hypothetical protein JW749_10665 [Sedimentisphaerales bacterium]|nr:hypothetical protein [Sedimentisphaerales bacterium]
MVKVFSGLFFVFISVCTVFAADVILNEYNAVGGGLYLNGGNASADDDGGRAGDTWFGRVEGNGGDWFEMAVITDHLDMRGWRLDLYGGGAFSETLTLSNHSIWSDLRSGTIITVSEDVASDINYNPAAGDWWINVQASGSASGAYITASNFVVSSNDWQLRIRDANGTVKFGPAGEGVSPTSGIGDTEIFRLEADPSASVTPTSADYDDGKDLSTFGAPNLWGNQNFNLLRTVAAQPGSLTLTSPNGSENIATGALWPITWQTTGTVADVTIEFSLDNGQTWTAVYPRNTGNTGSYEWFVPMVSSSQCRVRVVDTADLAVFDTSNAVFTIFQCLLDGDVDGDCAVDFYDFAILAEDWLQSAE